MEPPRGDVRVALDCGLRSVEDGCHCNISQVKDMDFWPILVMELPTGEGE